MDKKVLNKEIQAIVERLASGYDPEKVILFGSAARGEFKKGSDIDLLIVKGSRKKKVFRIKDVFEVLRPIKRKVPLEPLVYTPAELQERINLGDFFIERALKEGRALYEKA